MFGVIPAFWQRRVTGGVGNVTIYEGENLGPGGEPVGDPATQRTAFLARLDTVEVLDWEEWDAFGDPVYSSGTLLHSTSYTKNGVTVTFTCPGLPTAPRLFYQSNLGRFNTSRPNTPQPPNFYLPAEIYAENLPASTTTPLILTFDVPVAAFGFYATDLGDFNAAVEIVLAKSGGGTVTYTMHHTVPASDGALYFWGIVDTTGMTYTSATFVSSSASLSDRFGLDDLVFVPPSYIIP